VFGGITSPSSWGDSSQWQGRWKTLSAITDESPEMLWESWTEIQNTEEIQQEATLYCASTDSADSSPKAEPQEQRGLTLYTLVSRLQKQKRQNLTHIFCMQHYWLFHFPPPHSTMWSSCFNSLSLCYAIPSPSHYQNTDLSVSFLVLLPATEPLVPGSIFKFMVLVWTKFFKGFNWWRLKNYCIHLALATLFLKLCPHF
jgi:hypothetical protein